jgi:hypothetical protein
MNLTTEQLLPGKWLHVPDYARRFNLETETVYGWVKRKEIPFAIFAGRTMIPAACGMRDKWKGRTRRCRSRRRNTR